MKHKYTQNKEKANLAMFKMWVVTLQNSRSFQSQSTDKNEDTHVWCWKRTKFL